MRHQLQKHTNKNSLSNTVLTVALLLAGSILIFLAVQIVATQSLSETPTWILRHPLTSLTSIAAIFVVSASFYGLTGRPTPSFLLTGVPALVLCVISYFKTAINGIPLLITDFSFAGSLAEILGFAFPQLRPTVEITASVLIITATDILIHTVDKRKKLRFSFWPGRAVLLTVSSCLTALCLFTGLFLTPAADAARGLSQQERISDMGFLLAFYSAYAVSYEEKHEQMNDTIDEIIKEINEQNTKTPDKNDTKTPESNSGAGGQTGSDDPNLLTETESKENPSSDIGDPVVILLMSESFFDISRLGGIEYPQDITPNFHRLSENCTSGLFYSNTYAGGTGYVEMEVMTGISQAMLHEADTLTTLPDKAYSKMPTLAGVLKSRGYRTIFMHSYTPVLYNRQTIYSQFGFDEIMFSDSFPDNAERRGGYISDDAFADKIISIFNENDEGPFFLSAVSMENHQPYTDDKFDAKTDFHIESDCLNETNLEAVRNYAIGLHDACLGKLTDYFSAQKRPVMLIFFGDHLPNLGTEYTDNAYTNSGYVSEQTKNWTGEDQFKILTTDYLIWTNYEKTPAPDANVSATYMATTIMKRLGIPLTGYYKWLDEKIRPEITLRHNGVFVDGAFHIYDSLPKEKYDVIRRYSAVVYDIVYGENRIFGKK